MSFNVQFMNKVVAQVLRNTLVPRHVCSPVTPVTSLLQPVPHLHPVKSNQASVLVRQPIELGVVLQGGGGRGGEQMIDSQGGGAHSPRQLIDR